jgi:hypothetical protein
LRVGGTSLPPHLLLIAKLIVLTFLVKRVEPLSDVYLPFLRIFDQLNPMGFYRVSQVVFAAAAVALLVNRWVRAASFTLGSLILLALLASRPFNRDATLFCGAILLLIGLYVPRYGIWLLRLQIIVVYFGAAYNKFLEPDWPSGQFFQHWMTNTYGKAWYGWITSHFPPLLVSKVMSRMVMALSRGNLGRHAAAHGDAGLRKRNLQGIFLWDSCFLSGVCALAVVAREGYIR